MRYASLVIASLLASAGCLLAQAAEPAAGAAPRVAKAIPVMPALDQTALLRPNDLFDLRMSGMPPEDAAQFSGAPYNVGSDGSVSIPLIGKVQAAGLSPSQLERMIEKRLVDEKIFRWPNATVNVVTSVRFVTVGGAVRMPQRMSWSADLTLLSALSAAGGAGDFGGDKVSLVRGGKATFYSIKKLKKDPSQDPKLLPGDQLELL